MTSRAFDFDAEYGVGYDTLIRQVVPGYDDLHLATLALLNDVPDGGEVLVVGVGSGSELVTFGRARPGWRLTGVEPSGQMIGITQERLRRAGIDERVQIHHGYTDDLPDVERFDAATLVCVLHFLPDDGAKLDLLRSIARRLRPGGRFVLMDAFGAPGTVAFSRAWDAWMEFVAQKGLTGPDRDAYRRQVETGLHFIPQDRLVALMGEAGFTDLLPFYRALLFGGWLATRAG